MKKVRIWIFIGYMLISFLICILGCRWYIEWNELEKHEIENAKLNYFREKLHNTYIQLIEISLLGETMLDWDDKDLENYHLQRIAIDSMLCRIKNTYPAVRIDSVQHLLEDKEQQMYRIVQLLDE